MNKNRFLIVAALSTTLISLELVWTRIFSAEFFYTFAFLTISLAILGLGLGALTLHLFPILESRRYVGLALSLSGLMTLVGPVEAFHLGVKLPALFDGWAMGGKFMLTVSLLSSSFLFAGIALAAIFKRNHREIPRLYMADLLGAGAGILFALILMNSFGTPVAAFISAMPILIAAIIASERFFKIIPFALLVAAFAFCPYANNILDLERQERGPVIYKHWDAMAKVKVHDMSADYRNLNIDNVANSPVYGFDGNWDRPDSLRFQFGISVENLIDRFEQCRFLSLGAGGGADVLQALQAGATEIHAVEVNGHINDLMTSGELADFSGRIYSDPRVIVATEDARAYVRRFSNRFDLIYSLSSNSWAALASGSFALAENYLFTTEAFEDYWSALSDDGFLVMEHQFYMPRLVSEVIEALDHLGIPNPNNHFAVYNLPQMRRNLLLLSKRTLTDEIRDNAFAPLSVELRPYIYLLYPADSLAQGNLIEQIVSNGWRAASDSATVIISPCSDDQPFIAQMGKWQNFSWARLLAGRVLSLPLGVYGFPISKLIIIAILCVVALVIVPLNLLPYLMKGERLKPVPWLYFFTIGMAFMVVEVILMQKYTFFVGPSAYSIATILLTILISSGFGSRLSGRFDNKIVFPGIALWLLLDVFVFRHIIYGITGLGMIPRVLISAAFVAPLGFLMGMPFPKGALKVGPLVAWGFAVNGVASVLGATLVLLLAFAAGYNICLLLGALLYFLSFRLISLRNAW